MQKKHLVQQMFTCAIFLLMLGFFMPQLASSMDNGGHGDVKTDLSGLSFLSPKSNAVLISHQDADNSNYQMIARAQQGKAKVRVRQGVFLGEDQDAPDSGHFLFKVPGGQIKSYRCVDKFCDRMHRFANRKMEIVIKKVVYYHEGGESYIEEDFIQSFTVR